MKKKASKDDLAARRTIPPGGFGELLRDIKTHIRTGQMRAISAANAELVRLYWDIGRMIHERQEREGWGASVIPRLSAELRNELPELKGFFERNIGNMIAFYRAYPHPEEFLQQAAAKLPAPEEVQQAAAKRETLPQAPWHAALQGDCAMMGNMA